MDPVGVPKVHFEISNFGFEVTSSSDFTTPDFGIPDSGISIVSGSPNAKPFN
jgi:hypothetical protein